MRYLPHTAADRAELLKAVGLDSIEDLHRSIPKHLQLGRDLDLPAPLPEHQLIPHLEALAAKNTAATQYKSFLGAGSYGHYIPTAVGQMLLRQEWLTSYTPYQAEISQGTLQAMFEFQTLVCRLFGMEVSNASMYDGASSMAEAALMARRAVKGRNKLVVAETVHPAYRQVLATYVDSLGDEIVTLPAAPDGSLHADTLKGVVDANTYAVIVQSPNFFGLVESLPGLCKVAKDAGALFIVTATESLAYALLKAPGDIGADVVAAEGQSFGVSPQFGGPALGLFATRDELKRLMPGRLIGRTKDIEGNTAYCLTLATREQHIRRDKATSNICTNVGLNALAATIYLSLMGKTGLAELARRNAARANYLATKLGEAHNVELAFPRGLFFNEVAIRVKNGNAEDLLDRAQKNHKVLAGVPVGRFIPRYGDLIIAATTELHTKADVDALVAALVG
jgi:glycine dehydrogenase subunit 1